MIKDFETVLAFLDEVKEMDTTVAMSGMCMLVDMLSVKTKKSRAEILQTVSDMCDSVNAELGTIKF